MRTRRLLTALLLLAATSCGTSSVDDGDASPDVAEVATDTSGPGPVFEIDAPADSAVYLPGAAVPFEIHTTCLGCTIEVASDVDGDLFAEPATSSGRLSRTVTDLSPGSHALSLSLVHPDGRVLRTVTQSLRVDRLPGAPQVHLEPLAPTTADALTVAFDAYAVDPDGDPVSYTYRWSRDGAATLENGSKTLSATLTERGETWSVTVVPRDPWGDGPTASAQVVIGNSPPSVGTVVVLPSVGTADTVFSCTYYDWTDPDAGDPEQPSYVFLRNGAVVGGPAASPEFPPGQVRGDQIACRVIPSDGAAEGVPVDSPTVTIANAAPTVDGATLAPAQGDVTATFTCSAGATADADGDAVSLTWRWRRNGSLLAGESSDVVSGALFARGDHLRCEITPSDGVQDGLPVTSNEVVVADAPPVLVGVVLEPTEATEASVLTCTPGAASDPDGDPIGYVFDWLVDGVPVDGQHGATLTGQWFDKGQGVECAVTPESNGLQGTIVFAKTVTQVVNTPPALGGASLYPAEGGRQTLFTCVKGTVTDPDPGDPQLFAFSWTLNGQPVGGASGETFRPVDGTPGQVLRCRIDLGDGEAQAVPADSDGVTLLNHAPSLADVTLTPDEPTEGSALLCSANQGVDPDGDAVTLQIAWLVNGQVVPGQALAQLDGGSFDEGDAVACRVTPVDTFGLAGQALTSPPVTVRNSAPLAASAQITPTVGGPHTVFTCAPGSLVDPDPGDTATALYHWWRNGTLVEGQGQPTYDAGDATTGETVRCSITPFDGEQAGADVFSALVTLQNQPPSVSGVHVSPATLYVGSTPTCVAEGAMDPEGADVSLQYAWWVNSAEVPGATGDTLPLAGLERGDTVFCVVVPSDDVQAGSPRSSAPVTVSNSAPGAFDVAIEPPEPTLADPTLVCTVGTPPVDPDGDDLAWAYAWHPADGSSLGDAATLSTAGLPGCLLLRCEATASDGHGGTTQAVSAPAVLDGTFGAHFDGSASRVVVPSSPALDATGAFTVEAWVRQDASGTAAPLVSRGLVGGSRYALRITATGAPVFDLSTGGSGGGALSLTAASVLPAGQWVHVAGTWDGVTARLFVQGVQQAEAPLSGFLVPSGDLAAGAPPFTGDLDDLRLEATASYSADFVPTAPLAADAGTLLLLSFEHVATQGVLDAGPNGLPAQGTALTDAVGACFPAGQPDRAPSAPAVALSPLAPTVDDAITCQVTAPAVDPEGAPVSYDVTWLLNGSLQPDLAGQWTFPADRTDFCDVLTCRVTASDGALVGPPAQAEVQVEAPIVNEALKYHAWPGTPDPPENWVAGLPDPYSFAQTFTFDRTVRVLGMRFYLRGTYDTGGGKMRWRYDHAQPWLPDEKHFGTAVPYSTTGTTFQSPTAVVTGWNTYLFPNPITLDEPVVVMWTFGGTGTSSGRRVYFDGDGQNPETRNWVIDGGGQIYFADEYDAGITGDFLIELIIEGDQNGVCP